MQPAFTINLLGAAIFSVFPVYGAALVALFLIGMAMLQVFINPLMHVAGGEANFAFYSVMGQLVFGLKTALVLLLIPLAFILSISFWAKPLVANETISLKQPFRGKTEQAS